MVVTTSKGDEVEDGKTSNESGEDKSESGITVLFYFNECETFKNYLKEKETTPANTDNYHIEGAKV